MSRGLFGSLTGLLLMVVSVGCGPGPITADSSSPESVAQTKMLPAPPTADMLAETQPADDAKAGSREVAAVSGGTALLTPENTKIQFVGTHVGDKPDPRLGHFQIFSVNVQMNDGNLTALQVEIETASLKTEIDRLTDHLKSPDFFDVRQFPKASFKSTSIEPDGEGRVKITGDLTLLGNTKSISFPATVTTDGGLKLKAEFKIDRTEFGMNYGLDRVEREVAITVTAG